MSDNKKVNGKITSIQSSGKYTAKSGKNEGKIIYKFDVVLDGDEWGQSPFPEDEMVGTDPPIKVGETHTFTVYESRDPQYPPTWYLQKAGSVGGGYKGGAGSKWTPDPEKESRVERWAKQTLIGRQACLNTAASLIASGGGPSTLDNLFALADKIEEHVHRGVDIRRLAKGPDVKPAQVTSDPPAQYAKPAPAPAKADPNYTDTDGSPLPF